MDSLKELISEFSNLMHCHKMEGNYDTFYFCKYNDQIIYKRLLSGEIMEIGFGYFVKSIPKCPMYLTIEEDLFFVYHRKGLPAQYVMRPKSKTEFSTHFVDGWRLSAEKMNIINKMKEL